MLKDRALFQKVQQLLKDEIKEVSELHDLLKAETLALQNPDPAALAEVIKQKALPLAALEQSQRARYALLNELQHPANEDSWRDLLAQLDANTQGATQLLTPLLDSLLQTLSLCRTTNRVNEKVVSRSQYSVQHLLDIMRGNIPNNKLYGATGNTVTLSDAKPITAA
ncbi:MAG: flagella synthesis protein FlgN [Pseudomonadales bacterium]